MNQSVTVIVAALALAATTHVQADAFDDRLSAGAIAGTTGFGADLSWRFHENFALTGRYTDGLDFDTDYNDDGVDYEAEFGMQASSLKMDYFPFGGRFFLSAGAMMPDIEGGVTGNPESNASFDFNGTTYQSSEIGSVTGTATLADGVQPYIGLGWRSSHEEGFGFFSEFGVIPVDSSVSLSTTNGFENVNQQLQNDIRAEEAELESEIDDLPFVPVAVIGITYTF